MRRDHIRKKKTNSCVEIEIVQTLTERTFRESVSKLRESLMQIKALLDAHA